MERMSTPFTPIFSLSLEVQDAISKNQTVGGLHFQNTSRSHTLTHYRYFVQEL